MVRGCIRAESWECFYHKEGRKGDYVHEKKFVSQGYVYEGLINCVDCSHKYDSDNCKKHRKEYNCKVINT